MRVRPFWGRAVERRRLNGKRNEEFGGFGSGGGVGGLFGLAEMIARGGPIVYDAGWGCGHSGGARQGVRWWRRGWPGAESDQGAPVFGVLLDRGAVLGCGLAGQRVEEFGGFGADGRVWRLGGLTEMTAGAGPIVHRSESGAESDQGAAVLGVSLDRRAVFGGGGGEVP